MNSASDLQTSYDCQNKLSHQSEHQNCKTRESCFYAKTAGESNGEQNTSNEINSTDGSCCDWIPKATHNCTQENNRQMLQIVKRGSRSHHYLMPLLVGKLLSISTISNIWISHVRNFRSKGFLMFFSEVCLQPVIREVLCPRPHGYHHGYQEVLQSNC